MRTAAMIAALAIGLTGSLWGERAAAQAPGINPGRDCQTLVTCNYRKGGSYRGCLSSYSCRVCRLVPAPCQVSGGERRCQVMRCGWS